MFSAITALGVRAPVSTFVKCCLRNTYGCLTDGLRKFRPDGTEKKKQQHFRLVLGTLRQQLNSIDDVLADLCKRLYHQSGSILHVWISQKAQMYALD